MKYNSSVLFQVKRYMLCTKGTNESAKFLDFFVLELKSTKFLLFLKQRIGFSSNLEPLLSIMRRNSSRTFLAEILFTFNRRSLSKYKVGEISPEHSEV